LDLSGGHDIIKAMNLMLTILLLVLSSLLLLYCFPLLPGSGCCVAVCGWWGFAATGCLPDGELAYLEGGRGHSVLLIHGFGGDGPTSWARVMAALSSVITYWFRICSGLVAAMPQLRLHCRHRRMR
jgi:hypothetical protein